MCAGAWGEEKSTRRERGAIRTKTTTTRTIKRDTCKEAGNKGRPNKNNIGHEEKDTREKEKNKMRKNKQIHTHTQTHTHKRTRRHTTQKRRKTTGRTKNEERKRSDQGESEAEAPTKKNKHSQQKHRKIDQNHDKNSSTYCRRKVQSSK